MHKLTEKNILNCSINGKKQSLMVEAQWTLVYVLREKFGLTGTKEACGEGACGSCTVIIDGVATPACMVLAADQQEKHIETIEGLEKNGKLHPLQEAWIEEYGAQCGFCSPGMIMTAKALLDKTNNPNVDEIKEAMVGNICGGGNDEHIIGAVQNAALKMQGKANAI